VAEQRVLAQGEDRGKPSALAREVRVTDREHAAVQPVQATDSHAGVDRADTEARGTQLAEVHDAVLRRRDPRDPRVRPERVANMRHTNT